MGSCTDLANKAELQQYLPKTEKASIINTATSLSGQAVQGALALQGGKVAQALNASLAAQAKGEALLAANRVTNAAVQKAASSAAAASREALIAKGTAIANAQALEAVKAQAAQAAANAAKAQAAQLSGLAAVLAALPAILIAIASFGLIQAQLRATQARIDQQEKALDAYNADYTRLINMISQNAIAIKNNNAAISANNAVVRNNESAIAANNSRMLGVEATNRSLVNDLNQANQRINSLIGELNLVNSKAQTATSIAVATSNKLPPVPVIKDLTEISNLSAQNNQLRRQLELQQSDLNGYRVALNNFQARLPTEADKFITRKVREQTVTNASGIRDLSGQLVGLPSKVNESVNKEFTAKTVKFQEGVHKQVSEAIKVALPSFDLKRISAEIKASIGTIEEKFDDRFKQTEIDITKEQKIQEIKINNTVDTKIQKLEQVNNQQATEINAKLDKVDSKINLIPTPAQIAVAVGGLDILRQIKNKPTPTPFCLAPALVPPVGAQAKLNGGAIASLQAVTIAQNGLIQKAVNAVSKTTTKIQEVVTHKDYGLQKIQGFADIAWKATHADKILNGITTAIVLHNAVMLSNALSQTIGETASLALQAMGIKDSEGNAFNVNAIVKAKMTQLVSSIVGAENYKVLTAKIATANRIYQSSANMLDITRNMLDSARSVAELTAENTGKIGNALLESGTVYEDAYSEMIDKVNPQNKAQRRLEGLTNALGALEQGASAISEISSEVIETKDNITELKAEKAVWKKENEDLLKDKKDEKVVIKEDSQAATELAKIDFAKDETDS